MSTINLSVYVVQIADGSGWRDYKEVGPKCFAVRLAQWLTLHGRPARVFEYPF